MRTSVFILVFSFSRLYAQIDIKVDGKSDKDGVAIMAGVGVLYGGGIGALAEYQFLQKEGRRISPYVAPGIIWANADIKGIWPGGSVGVNCEFGKKLRWTVGINYGSHGMGYDKRYNSKTDSSRVEYIHRHLLVGPSVISGYKYVSHSGFIWAVCLGIAYMNNPIGQSRAYFLSPVAGASIGYKL